MTLEWVLNDNITSAETVVQMMFNSMPENLRRILFCRTSRPSAVWFEAVERLLFSRMATETRLTLPISFLLLIFFFDRNIISKC